MKITVKGQVKIPKLIRERYGLRPGSEVRFVEEDRRGVLRETGPRGGGCLEEIPWLLETSDADQ